MAVILTSFHMALLINGKQKNGRAGIGVLWCQRGEKAGLGLTGQFVRKEKEVASRTLCPAGLETEAPTRCPYLPGTPRGVR